MLATIEPQAPTTTMTHIFRAMGCRIEIQLVHDASAAADQATGLAFSTTQSRFARYEEELSRFLATSGLTRLNDAAGAGPQPVSPLLLMVTREALAAAVVTDGMFDPTLGTVLAHLGYDRSFPLVPAFADDAVPVLVPPHRHGAWREVIVEPAVGTIALPAGMALDFGGIVKGLVVDRTVTMLRRVFGVRGGLVNAGGDLRVWGDAPDGAAAWLIGVEDPRDGDRDCAVVHLREGAVATSSTAYRRWQRGDRWVHHLLDPRTGQPATTDVAAVTVTGPSAMWAEIHAKVALLSGMVAGRAYLEAHDGYDGLLIATDGTRDCTAGMGGYLR